MRRAAGIFPERRGVNCGRPCGQGARDAGDPGCGKRADGREEQFARVRGPRSGAQGQIIAGKGREWRGRGNARAAAARAPRGVAGHFAQGRPRWAQFSRISGRAAPRRRRGPRARQRGTRARALRAFPQNIAPQSRKPNGQNISSQAVRSWSSETGSFTLKITRISK